MSRLLSLVVCLALLGFAAGLPVARRADSVLMETENSNACVKYGGACADIRTTKCSNGFKTGMCPGSVSMQCCTAALTDRVASPAAPVAAAAAAAPAPVAAAVSSSGSSCSKKGGECLDSATASCSTGFKTGLCPGAASIKCCLKASTPSRAAPAPTTPAVPSTPTPAVQPTPASSGKPTFAKLAACYPQGDADTVKKNIGGAVNAAWVTNTCAIRMSQTLNCAGKFVPQMGGESIRGKTPNRWNYIFRVKQLSPYIKRQYGAGVTIKAPSGRGVPQAQLKGKQGIIYFDTTGTWDDATGHFDLWDGQSMVETSHDNPETVNRYFDSSISVTFWQF